MDSKDITVTGVGYKSFWDCRYEHELPDRPVVFGSRGQVGTFVGTLKSLYLLYDKQCVMHQIWVITSKYFKTSKNYQIEDNLFLICKVFFFFCPCLPPLLFASDASLTYTFNGPIFQGLVAVETTPSHGIIFIPTKCRLLSTFVQICLCDVIITSRTTVREVADDDDNKVNIKKKSTC